MRLSVWIFPLDFWVSVINIQDGQTSRNGEICLNWFPNLYGSKSKKMHKEITNESPVIFTSLCFWSSIGIPSTKQIKVTCDAEPSINNLNEEVDIAAWSSSWMYVSTSCSTRVLFSFHLRFTLGNEGSVEQLNMSSSPSWICSGPTIFRVVGLSKNQFIF